MNRVLKFKKSFLSIVFVIFTLLVLVACGNKDQDIVDEAIEEVIVVFQTGDNANSVTKDITLMPSVGDLTVTWTSSNTAAIALDGKVVRTFSDVAVTLTAKIVLGSAEATKTFNLTVKGHDVQAALNSIVLSGDNITYNSTTQIYTATGNITLPSQANGLTITWVSDLPAFITQTGVVTIPAYGQANVTVTLIASINNVEKEFTVIVPASTVAPDQTMLFLEQARDALLIPGVADGVTQNLLLPTTVGTNGVTVTWSSNTPAIISNTGAVIRPSSNTDVVLTATLLLNSQTLTKVFNLTVLAAVDYVLVANIAEAIEISVNSEGALVNTYVKIPDVTVIGRSDDGVYIADSTGILFLFSVFRSVPLQIGGVYDVLGMTDNGFGTWQLSNHARYSSKPVVLTPSSGAATVLTPVVAESVTDMLSNHQVPTETSLDFTITYYRLTAKVRIQSTTDNYGTILVDPDYNGPDVPAGASGAVHTVDGVVVYYQSNKAAFNLLHGQTITVNVVMHGYRSDRLIYYVYFVGDVSDIDVTLDTTGTLNLVESTLKNDVSSTYTANTTLNLRDELFGASIAWTSNNALINPETGAVTMPTEGQVQVTLTATVILNDTERIVTINVLVGQLQTISIQEARAKAVGTRVKIQGVITGYAYATSFNNAAVYIQDETGGILLHQLANSAALKVGDIINLEGVIGQSNGNIRLAQGTAITVVSSNNAFVGKEVKSTDTFIDYQGQYVYVTGTLKAKPAINLTNWDDTTIVVVGTTEVKIYIPHPGDMSAADRTALINLLQGLEAGETVSVFGPMGWFNGPQIIAYKAADVVVGGYIDLTDQGKANAAAAAINIANEYEVAGTIVLPATGIHGATITWISSHPEYYNAETGVIVMPASGSVQVTLTATVTVNDKEAERTIVVTVGEIVRDISDVRLLPVGTVVTVEALVTYAWTHSSGTRNAFIQDDTAGIYVFSIPVADADKALVGSVIRIRGTVAINRTNIQLTPITKVEVVSTGNPVTPVEITDYSEFAANMGKLATFTGYLNTTYGGTVQNFTLVSETGSVLIRFNQSAQNTNLSTAVIGSKVTVTAGVALDNGATQVLIFYAADATATSSTEAERGAVAAANFTPPAASAEVVANITLPTTGLFGSTVVWTSDKPSVISNSGEVTRPTTADEVVTLSYELKIGDNIYETGTVVYTVLKEVSSTVNYTLAYDFNFTTTSMTNSYSTSTAATLQNLVTVANIDITTRLRAAVNIVTNYETNNKALILSGSTSGGSGQAYIEFDFGSSVIEKTEFIVFPWSAADYGTATTIALQVKDGEGQWVTILNLLPLIGSAIATAPYQVELTGFTGSVVRLLVEGTTSSVSNGTRIVFDNMKFYTVTP